MKCQIKKKQKYNFVQLLIPTLNKINGYQFLVILLEGVNQEPSSQSN